MLKGRFAKAGRSFVGSMTTQSPGSDLNSSAMADVGFGSWGLGLILETLHDLNILEDSNFQGMRHLASNRIFNIHCSSYL